VGNAYVNVAESAVREEIAYVAERLRAVRSVLHQEQFSTEVQYPFQAMQPCRTHEGRVYASRLRRRDYPMAGLRPS
jgi:hypothetical protein